MHRLGAICGGEVVKVYADLSGVLKQPVVGFVTENARPCDKWQFLFRFALLVAVRRHGAEIENWFAPFAITNTHQHVAGGAGLQFPRLLNIKPKGTGAEMLVGVVILLLPFDAGAGKRVGLSVH